MSNEVKQNFIGNLKKAVQSQSITKDTFSLKNYAIKFADEKTGTPARMRVIAMENKYVPKFDKQRTGEEGSSGNRTRFYLQDGSTVGTFSNGVHEFFRAFAVLMGYTGDEQFLHIDIDGAVNIDVRQIQLGTNAAGEPTYTYNLEVAEEGSEFFGMKDYQPNAENMLALSSGQYVNKETGELTLNPEMKAADEQSAPEPKPGK